MRNTTQHNALRAAIGIAAAALVATPITLSLSTQDNQPATTPITHTTAAPPAPPAADISTYEAAGVLMVGVNNYDDALNVLNQGAAGIFIGSWTDPALIQQLPQLKEAIGRPFKVSIDAEGGRVVRQPALFGNLPSPRVMAATMTPQQVQNTAYDLGTRLHNADINVDFAPVLDLDAGDPNGAIGDRSFSDNPTIAATYGAAFVQGLADAGVQPVLKHFPGHGHASGDSHIGDVTTPPLDALLREDLTPYATILQHCQPAIMFGHLDVPGLGDQPTTINPAAYELLRSGNYGGPPFTAPSTPMTYPACARSPNASPCQKLQHKPSLRVLTSRYGLTRVNFRPQRKRSPMLSTAAKSPRNNFATKPPEHKQTLDLIPAAH